MINRYELYEDMTDEQLMALGLSDEELARIYLERAVEYAKTTLRLAENCYERFGERILTDAQDTYFRKMVNGITPTDDEQAAVDMDTVWQLREVEKRQAAKLGEAYHPILAFEDKTDGYAVN